MSALHHLPQHIWELPHDERMAAIAEIEAPMPKSSREIHLTGDVVDLLRLLESTPEIRRNLAIQHHVRSVKEALTRFGIITNKPIILKAIEVTQGSDK